MKDVTNLWNTASLGITMVISTAVGLVIGIYLDKFFGTAPILTIAFVLLGITSGLRDIIRTARRMTKTIEQKEELNKK